MQGAKFSLISPRGLPTCYFRLGSRGPETRELRESDFRNRVKHVNWQQSSVKQCHGPFVQMAHSVGSLVGSKLSIGHQVASCGAWNAWLEASAAHQARAHANTPIRAPVPSALSGHQPIPHQSKHHNPDVVRVHHEDCDDFVEVLIATSSPILSLHCASWYHTDDGAHSNSTTSPAGAGRDAPGREPSTAAFVAVCPDGAYGFTASVDTASKFGPAGAWSTFGAQRQPVVTCSSAARLVLPVRDRRIVAVVPVRHNGFGAQQTISNGGGAVVMPQPAGMFIMLHAPSGDVGSKGAPIHQCVAATLVAVYTPPSPPSPLADASGKVDSAGRNDRPVIATIGSVDLPSNIVRPTHKPKACLAVMLAAPMKGYSAASGDAGCSGECSATSEAPANNRVCHIETSMHVCLLISNGGRLQSMVLCFGLKPAFSASTIPAGPDAVPSADGGNAVQGHAELHMSATASNATSGGGNTTFLGGLSSSERHSNHSQYGDIRAITLLPTPPPSVAHSCHRHRLQRPPQHLLVAVTTDAPLQLISAGVDSGLVGRGSDIIAAASSTTTIVSTAAPSIAPTVVATASSSAAVTAAAPPPLPLPQPVFVSPGLNQIVAEMALLAGGRSKMKATAVAGIGSVATEAEDDGVDGSDAANDVGNEAGSESSAVIGRVAGSGSVLASLMNINYAGDDDEADGGDGDHKGASGSHHTGHGNYVQQHPSKSVRGIVSSPHATSHGATGTSSSGLRGMITEMPSQVQASSGRPGAAGSASAAATSAAGGPVRPLPHLHIVSVAIEGECDAAATNSIMSAPNSSSNISGGASIGSTCMSQPCRPLTLHLAPSPSASSLSIHPDVIQVASTSKRAACASQPADGSRQDYQCSQCSFVIAVGSSSVQSLPATHSSSAAAAWSSTHSAGSIVNIFAGTVSSKASSSTSPHLYGVDVRPASRRGSGGPLASDASAHAPPPHAVVLPGAASILGLRLLMMQADNNDNGDGLAGALNGAASTAAGALCALVGRHAQLSVASHVSAAAAQPAHASVASSAIDNRTSASGTGAGDLTEQQLRHSSMAASDHQRQHSASASSSSSASKEVALSLSFVMAPLHLPHTAAAPAAAASNSGRIDAAVEARPRTSVAAASAITDDAYDVASARGHSTGLLSSANGNGHIDAGVRDSRSATGRNHDRASVGDHWPWVRDAVGQQGRPQPMQLDSQDPSRLLLLAEADAIECLALAKAAAAMRRLADLANTSGTSDISQGSSDHDDDSRRRDVTSRTDAVRATVAAALAMCARYA